MFAAFPRGKHFISSQWLQILNRWKSKMERPGSFPPGDGPSYGGAPIERSKTGVEKEAGSLSSGPFAAPSVTLLSILRLQNRQTRVSPSSCRCSSIQ